MKIFTLLAIIIGSSACFARAYTCRPLVQFPKNLSFEREFDDAKYKVTVSTNSDVIAQCSRDWRQATTYVTAKQTFVTIEVLKNSQSLYEQSFDKVFIHRENKLLYPSVESEVGLISLKLLEDKYLVELKFKKDGRVLRRSYQVEL